MWWSTKERGFYWASIVLGLLLLLAAQRVVEGRRPLVDGAVFGLVAGLGFWTSPTVLYFAVPATLWVLLRRSPPLRWIATALPAAIVGALPWIWHNVEHGLTSLSTTSQPEDPSYGTALGRVVWRALPILLNVRRPISELWTASAAPYLYLVLGLGFVVACVRRPDRPTLVILAIVAFPLLYATFPTAWYVGEGRYVVYAGPFLALAIAWLVRWPWVALGLALFGVVLGFPLVRDLGTVPPQDLHADVAAMERAGVDGGWAWYWYAYRFTFVSDGTLDVAPTSDSRDPALDAAVERDPTPAFIYRRGDEAAPLLLDLFPDRSRLLRTPNFDVVMVDGPVDLRTLPVAAVPD